MTYGIPYTVRGWGDEIVTTATIDAFSEDPPDGYRHVVRAGGGPVILVPTSALTPVDTTPAEPEPGAWLISETLCIRLSRPIERPWFRETSQGRTFETWAETWAAIGGPGITPRRLVPEPAVDLPAEAKSHYQNTVIIDHYDGATVSMTLPKRLTEWFDPDNAEILGNAFLTAARAAREATP